MTKKKTTGKNTVQRKRKIERMKWEKLEPWLSSSLSKRTSVILEQKEESKNLKYSRCMFKMQKGVSVHITS